MNWVLVIILAIVVAILLYYAAPLILLPLAAASGGNGRNNVIESATARGNYLPPKSDGQIRQVATRGSTAEYSRLMALLGKYLPVRDRRDICRLVMRGDRDVYGTICEYFDKGSADSIAARGERLGDELARVWTSRCASLSPGIDKGSRYLDIGCEHGAITARFADALGIRDINCIEVDPDLKHSAVKYVYVKGDEDPELPYRDKSVDIVTCFMSLHHVQRLSAMVAEIRRVLSPGGRVLIREHDQWTAADAMLTDIEHAVYIKCGNEHEYGGSGYPYHFKNIYGWDAAMSPLRPLAGDFFYTSARPEITPTRSFWRLYGL